MTLKDLNEILKAHGYRLTEPRKVILTLLLQNIHNIMSADDLYNMAKKISVKVNRSTVYRNIEILTELDLLYRSLNSEGTARYKLICSENHHHHLICDICGQIVIYDTCEDVLYNKFAKEHGFKLTGHTLELHGICAKCQL